MSTATAPKTAQNIGRITQIIGSTFDVEYAEDRLPTIYNAVKIASEHKGVKINLTGEVQRSRDTDVTYVENLPSSSFEWHRSDGIGLSYAFAPSLVFKVEHHWDRGIQIEQPAHPLTAPKFKYVIASLSASF